VFKRIPGVSVNGDATRRLPNTTSLAFDGVESEAMLILLDQAGVCCSAGSACTTGQHEPSHVLRAMGFDDTRARSSLRFSFGRFNTKAQIARAIDLLEAAARRVREVAVAA
jgi:cysteine desulfurase